MILFGHIIIIAQSFIWQEVKKAWKLLDQNQEKEKRYKETVESLKVEIGNLSRLVQQGEGLSMTQDQR